MHVELIPLEDCRLSVVDFEDYVQRDRWLRRREWTVNFARAQPASLTLAIEWISGETNREPSSVERLGIALAAALGWEVAPVPHDFAA